MGEDASQRSDVDGAAAGQVDEAGGLSDDVYCPECDYNLRGLTSDRCPECGSAVDAARLAGSQIPWVHRSRIGWYRAYWQTVWLVMFRTKRFCREIAHPVSYRDSQSFRWVSVLHAFVPMVVVMTVAEFGTPAQERLFTTNPSNAVALGVLSVSLFLALAAVTGLPSYFFHPKSLSIEHQNRAIAMSYYSYAGLAWTPMTFALLGVYLLMSWLDLRTVVIKGVWLDPDVAKMFSAVSAILIFGSQVGASWLSWMRISRRSLLRAPGSFLRMAILVPVLWVLVGGLILVGIPLAFLYVALVFVSLN